MTQSAAECLDLSGKMMMLNALLPRVCGAHKTLIFSYSTRMLDMIQLAVLRPNGLKFLRIDGAVDLEEREKKLKKFEKEGSKFRVLCLSTKVGGVGLTLTS